MKRSILFVVQLVVALATSSAGAADKAVYVGGSIARVDSDVGFGLAPSYDASDGGYKLFAGVRLLNWLAVEGGYQYLGRITWIGPIVPDGSYFYENQKAFSVFGVFLRDLRKLDLYAKTGLVRWGVDGSHDSIAGPIDFSEQGTDFAWGIGVQGDLGGNAAWRLKYEQLEFDNFFTTFRARKVISAGFAWTFR